ncbi:hypothetical protein Golax_025704 [Gossypium laxum]|uniref:Uncharacterized protein n=1 Tax=Gossypium laxum TaxID=34288 RepID=A0A7J9B196_9ROSI|nr:hypothetical protein [Gossypium laxum]
MVTSQYNEWWNKRVNDNIPKLREEDVRPIEEYLQVVLSEIEIINLKMDYKKLRRSIRTTGLGKTSKQWRQEIQEEKTKADQWEKKFQDS